MGTFYPSNENSVRLEDLEVILHGADLGSRLCIAINSIDGRYEARGSYDISGKPDGTYGLAVPAMKGRNLTMYDASSLGVLAWTQQSCDLETAIKAGLKILPVSWGHPLIAGEAVLLLNVFGHDSEIWLEPSEVPKFASSAIQSSSLPKISFDTQCRLGLSQRGWLSISLHRWAFEKPSPAIRFLFFLP